MEELIRVRNHSFARYEELLMRRDKLKKEALFYDWEYIRKFGDKILRNFQLKLECIRKKKTISYCQMALNRGGQVDTMAMLEYLQQVMAEYQKQLDDMVTDNENAKKSQQVSESDLLEIKKIYRRLAKKLHPDMNPKAAENPKLRELWERISVAYRCNQLENLRELELLANAAMAECGAGEFSTDISDLEEKIAKVEAEIELILNTDPYLYKELLKDPEAVEEKNAELDEEYAAYEDYARQLDAILEDLKQKGVTLEWQTS